MKRWPQFQLPEGGFEQVYAGTDDGLPRVVVGSDNLFDRRGFFVHLRITHDQLSYSTVAITDTFTPPFTYTGPESCAGINAVGYVFGGGFTELFDGNLSFTPTETVFRVPVSDIYIQEAGNGVFFKINEGPWQLAYSMKSKKESRYLSFSNQSSSDMHVSLLP
jgi:hypothetical protein